jgi:large subunit ribosomal protein L30
MTFVAVRIRGTVNVKPTIKKTLQLLNLTRTNHCVLLEEKPSIKGMLQIAKDYITWGEIDKKNLTDLIISRAKLEGNKNLTKDYLMSATSFDTFDELSQAILDKKIKFKEIPNVKPIFRLHPPKRGYLSIKNSYSKKGDLGYRGKKINRLIERML